MHRGDELLSNIYCSGAVHRHPPTIFSPKLRSLFLAEFVALMRSVGFAQELSHTHKHTTPARETMNTRISGDERRGDERRGDERLYLGLLFHWTWQKKTVEYRGYLSARGHTHMSHELPARPSRQDSHDPTLNVMHAREGRK